MEAVGDVLYGGIRPDIPGHGGEVCAGFLTPKWMVFETLLSTMMMITVGVIGWYTYTMPTTFPKERQSTAKQCLLVLLCLVFGIEVGYKICSKQVLYLLNPCHVLTAIEVAILLCINQYEIVRIVLSGYWIDVVKHFFPVIFNYQLALFIMIRVSLD